MSRRGYAVEGTDTSSRRLFLRLQDAPLPFFGAPCTNLTHTLSCLNCTRNLPGGNTAGPLVNTQRGLSQSLNDKDGHSFRSLNRQFSTSEDTIRTKWNRKKTCPWTLNFVPNSSIGIWSQYTNMCD